MTNVVVYARIIIEETNRKRRQTMTTVATLGRWDVRVGGDGTVYCTCPAWRFQRRPAGDREPCKHILKVEKEMGKTLAKAVIAEVTR